MSYEFLPDPGCAVLPMDAKHRWAACSLLFAEITQPKALVVSVFDLSVFF